MGKITSPLFTLHFFPSTFVNVTRIFSLPRPRPGAKSLPRLFYLSRVPVISPRSGPAHARQGATHGGLNSKTRDVQPVMSLVPTEAPTILLANRNRPVVQPIGPLAIGPAYSPSYVRLHCLVNGLPYWATGYLVRQQAGL